MLLISSRMRRSIGNERRSFNLVIEMLLISSWSHNLTEFLNSASFQSRNRDAFDFKLIDQLTSYTSPACFNLVIEMLLISSRCVGYWDYDCTICFNLVIEMLLISRMDRPLHRWVRLQSFNLVIEMLLISSSINAIRISVIMFGFNLVIEMLLISSVVCCYQSNFQRIQVSIS